MSKLIGIAKCKIYFNDSVIFSRKIMKIKVEVQNQKVLFLHLVKTFQTIKKLKMVTIRIHKVFNLLKSRKNSFSNKRMKNIKRKLKKPKMMKLLKLLIKLLRKILYIQTLTEIIWLLIWWRSLICLKMIRRQISLLKRRVHKSQFRSQTSKTSITKSIYSTKLLL